MAQSAVSPTTDSLLTPVPLRTIAPWALFGGILMLVLPYVVGAGQGAGSLVPGEGVREWLHDGRHLLGFASR
ncbi:cobalt transporter [Streptomyces sp. WAC 06738]|uniref:CbtB-domain containing protein n=1 Tax=Streptomyces sp. WAC 06738 TaxID=2203210 RepID=UPI000F6EBC6A|nr:CbtB-domain containing protein [Streptomyces sp. WAC 06738]AZM45362.1 cobalt transporter [Streptomyces sp. WAC 06738]